MKLTDHFNSEEFNCKDGTPYPPPWVKDRLQPLVEALEIVRQSTGKPLIILSGYRTAAWNQKVRDAVKGSQHLLGRAADIRCAGFTGEQLAEVFEKLIKDRLIPDGGLGTYSNRVHYDQRVKPARWRG